MRLVQRSMVMVAVLAVIGKGQKRREVPLPEKVVSELAKYLAARGLEPDPEDASNRGAYLLGRATDANERMPTLAGVLIDPRAGIAANTLHDQMKAFFELCAREMRNRGDARSADRFSRASTHWLRHSHASHAIAKGMPIEVAQQNLGHASLATVTVYVTTEGKRRMTAVDGFWNGRAT